MFVNSNALVSFDAPFKAPIEFLSSESLVKEAGKYVSAINLSLKTSDAAGTANLLSEPVDSSTVTARNESTKRRLVFPPISVLRSAARPENTVPDADASPLQIWEGRILQVNHENRSMEVLLSAKMGNVADHTGEIDLEWVSEQDIDLVRPGAVFYLTLYKRLKRGTVENAQELRFRRLPNWSRHQLKQVKDVTQVMLSKVRAGRIAE